MRPPELMHTPRAPGWVVGLFRGTRLKPSHVPATNPHRLSLMLSPPPVRVTCTLAGASMRWSTGSLALQLPLPLVSWQMIQPQSQSLVPVALVQPLVLFGNFWIAICPPRLIASDRAKYKLELSCSVAWRTLQLSIRGVKLGAAKAANMATMETVTNNSIAVNPPAR